MMASKKDTREPKPCIEYVRVSTQEQGRSGLGLEAQREAIKRFCEAERFNVVASFVEIESAKGDTLARRPKLKAALKAARRIKDQDYRVKPHAWGLDGFLKVGGQGCLVQNHAGKGGSFRRAPLCAREHFQIDGRRSFVQ
jgi:hypothetical protein